MDLATPEQPLLTLATAEHFIARIGALIDWGRADAPTTGDALEAGESLPLFALKLALIKHWYGLTDQEAQFQILDRTSLREFVGFAGDGGAVDVRILNELRDCAWGHHPAMADALGSIEDQLRDLGYAVRSGQVREPSLAPCTESGSRVPSSESTMVFRPGELGRMVEAVTAKAHAQGVQPLSGRDRAPDAGTMDMDAASGELATESSPAPGEALVRAVLEWPWGQCSELTEHLNIGRDYAFSSFARELMPYTHVSRKHAELLVYGDGVWVRDLGSRNGTYVNDEEVPKGQAYLIDADSIIRFGPMLAITLKISG
jgi:hypothetical protein